MNEQDLIIQKKIEKREKTDIMLAYILIVVLTLGIIFILYLKFIKNKDVKDEVPTEYTVNSITLNDIANSLSSNLSSSYNTLTALANENSILVSYGDINYTIPLVNNELVFTIDNDNQELSKDIYTEALASVCTFYRNDREGCKNAASSVSEDISITGVRFADNNVYITILNSISPIETPTVPIYNTEIDTNIDTAFEVEMNNTKISNIVIDTTDKVTVTGDIIYTGDKTSSKVTVKLYDENSTLLEEKSIDAEDKFSIIFEYSDTLKIENVKKYSVVAE